MLCGYRDYRNRGDAGPAGEPGGESGPRAFFEMEKNMSNDDHSFMKPGNRVEILSKGAVKSDDRWREWEILDWEIPRRAADGRWKFTAKTTDGQLGPSPLIIEEERIRWPMSGLERALKKADIRGPLQYGNG